MRTGRRRQWLGKQLAPLYPPTELTSSPRTLATAIVVTSLAVHFTPFLDGYQIYFSTHRLLRFPPEIWRLVTSFLLSGDGLQLILDPLWAYQNLRSLEVGHPKFGRREDVLWYLITVGGFIIVGHLSSCHPPLLHQCTSLYLPA